MCNVHLLVLIHGMWGNPGHLSELNRIIHETHSEPNADGVELRVLVAETNREDSTYDGIDWGGERVAAEVTDMIKELEVEGHKVVRFSVTGYSLGGLVARYLIGILYQRGFFENVTPVNFNTIATPHIGLPRYPSFMSSVLSALGPKLLSRTGEQFYCVDKWSPSGRPLILVMADPDRIFYQALAQFQHIIIYANAVNDATVPYVTSSIESEDPFAEHITNGIEIDFDKEYEHVIKSYELPDVPPPPLPTPTPLTPGWFRSLKPTRPLLPPFLQLRFPLNIVLYTFLPLLIPIGITLAIVRFSLATRSSRARIKLLENDQGEQTLINILAKLEKEMENAVADLVDDPESSLVTKPPPKQPILTAHQRKIVAWLNQLPLRKELVFFPDARNAHGMIVCRDVKRFEIHRRGEGLVRKWAGSLIL